MKQNRNRVTDISLVAATSEVQWSDLDRSLLLIHELTWYSLCQLSSLSCKTLKEDVLVSLLKVSAMSVQQQPVRNGFRWTVTAGVSPSECAAVEIPEGRLLAFSPPATPVPGSALVVVTKATMAEGPTSGPRSFYSIAE